MARVEQVSEQVAATIPFATTTTAEVEQVRRALAWEDNRIKNTTICVISPIQPRAHRGDS